MQDQPTDVILNMTERQSKLGINDGTRSFSITQNKCYEHECPFDENQEVSIKITSNEHDIHQLKDTYIHMVFDVEFQLSNQITSSQGINPAPPEILFIGWRNSTEVFRQIEVLNMEMNTGYLQRECAKEGFAMGTYKTMEEKRNQKFVHSLYEDVIRSRAGVCGGYVDYGADILANTTYKIENVEVIIPITDIPAFQYMDELPGLIGDITLKFYINRNSMVWAQCDPYLTFQEHGKINGINNNLDARFIYVNYDPKFFQVGRSGRIINYYGTVMNYPRTLNITLNVTKLTCKKCVCDCYGYNVNDACKAKLAKLFSKESISYIPCKQVDVVHYTVPIFRTYDADPINPQLLPVPPGDIDYTGDLTVPLRNVSDILLVFPKNGTDQTVFSNPVLKKLQLRINGKQYPKEPFATTSGARFTAIQIRAGYNEKYCEIDKEWLDSINRNILWNGYEFNDTACLIRFQLKRNTPEGKEMVYDGIETGTENVNIQLSFVATADTHSDIKKCNPELWLIRDTFWEASAQNGLKYYKYGSAL